MRSMIFFATPKQHVNHVRLIAFDIILYPRKTTAHLEQILQGDEPAVVVLPRSNSSWHPHIEQPVHLSHTNERMNDAVAEPVVYMMDRYVVGGFYRVHAERGVDENLNAPGASFVPLAFAETPHLPQPGMKPGASVPNRFYMYGVIGRLAMLAASYELESTDPEAEVYD